jgi:hypothetical protein
MSMKSKKQISKSKIIASRILAGIVSLLLAATAIMKIIHVPQMVDGLTHAGIPEAQVLWIALLELTCLAFYAIPRTAVLGAVLLTGYFGGAIVVHIIIQQSVVPLIIIGLLVWGGVYFRFPALRRLLPWEAEGEPATVVAPSASPMKLPNASTSAHRA